MYLIVPAVHSCLGRCRDSLFVDWNRRTSHRHIFPSRTQSHPPPVPIRLHSAACSCTALGTYIIVHSYEVLKPVKNDKIMIHYKNPRPCKILKLTLIISKQGTVILINPSFLQFLCNSNFLWHNGLFWSLDGQLIEVPEFIPFTKTSINYCCWLLYVYHI